MNPVWPAEPTLTNLTLLMGEGGGATPSYTIYEVHSISFQTFFVQAFMIAVNSRYFSILLLYSLCDD